MGTPSLTTTPQVTPSVVQATVAPPSAKALEALVDFESRILKYYKEKGKWPSTSSPKNFTDIGLNPDDWSKPVDGLYLSPNGSKVNLANKKGDNLQVIC